MDAREAMDAGPFERLGLRARPMTGADVAAVTALVAACETADDGVAEIDADDVAMALDRPGFDAATDSVLLYDGPALAAWADVYKERAEAAVHPDHRSRGIGTALLAWTERRAAALGTPRVGQVVTDANTAAAELFRRHGYRPAHTSWILQISHDDAPPAPPVPPAGVAIRAYRPGRDEHAVYRVVEDAFGEWPGRRPVAFDEWASLAVRHGSFAPDLSPLAWAGDELVGVALALDYRGADEGWIQQLATKAAYRGRGVARALLATAFAGFHARGKRRCGLSTDSRTGALALYEHVGMRVRRSYTNYAKDLAGRGQVQG